MILCGDVLEKLKVLPDESVQCCITSPPYFGLRDYGCAGQIGLEQTPEEYVSKLVEVFWEVRRILKKDGTLWLNLGDSYAGSGKVQFSDGEHDPKRNKTDGMKLESGKKYGLKSKDLIGIPWRVAFALQADGWWLRQDIIWAKPNPMPESVTDRCTKAHEYIFLFTKSSKYYFDADAIRERSVGRALFGNSRKKGPCEQRQDNNRQNMTLTETRNRRSVWTLATHPYKEAHFATFPEALIEPMVLAGSKKGDVVADCFAGSGTTLCVAKKLGRDYLGIELNPKYINLINKRLSAVPNPML